MNFYVGLHQPSDAQHFARCMISIGRLVERHADGTIQRRTDGTLRARLAPIACQDVMIDPQAFRILELHGRYPDPVATYAELLRHICTICGVISATAEDYMCEPFMLAKTGLTIAEHQRLTIARYDELLSYAPPCPIMPVLQGWTPRQYVSHLAQYGDRLTEDAWVGVGSVCKRNTDPAAIKAVFGAIKAERPDLRLHGFGVKTTALRSSQIRQLLFSADSMAWSSHERHTRSGDANNWRAAHAFADHINARPGLGPLFGEH